MSMSGILIFFVLGDVKFGYILGSKLCSVFGARSYVIVFHFQLKIINFAMVS